MTTSKLWTSLPSVVTDTMTDYNEYSAYTNDIWLWWTWWKQSELLFLWSNSWKNSKFDKKETLLTGAFNHISWSTSSDRADSICQWRLWDAVENFLKS